MAQRWMYLKNETEHGPLTSKELQALVRSGQLVADDQVRRCDSSTWHRAGRVKGLFERQAPDSTSKASASGSGEGVTGCGCLIVLAVLGWFSWDYVTDVKRDIANLFTPSTPNIEHNFVKREAVNKTDEFRSQLRNWVQNRETLNDAVTKLVEARTNLVEMMRAVGRDSPSARVLAEEILELDTQTTILKKKAQTYETAIAKADSALRRIERRQMLKDVGVSDDELNELAATAFELDDSLDQMASDAVTLELDVDDVMNEVFSDQDDTAHD